MIIKNLEIRGFGRHYQLDLVFNKGLNIIYGDNESGKTTILEFIIAMLYGLRNGRASKEGLPPPQKRLKPWNGSSFGGIMEYMLESGAGYRVERNFDANKAAIYDSNFKDITSSFELNKDRTARFAEQHIGVNEACFSRTALIRQASVVSGEQNEELVNKLINMMQTGFEDVSYVNAADTLNKALRTHVGTERTFTRPLDKILSRLRELSAAKKELTDRRNSYTTLEEDLRDMTSELETYKAEADKLRRALEQIKEERQNEDAVNEKNRAAARKKFTFIGGLAVGILAFVAYFLNRYADGPFAYVVPIALPGILFFVFYKYLHSDRFQSVKAKNEHNEIEAAELTRQNQALADIILELSLKIRENETLLRNAPDDDELQEVEEEISALETRKAELEETGKALKIAYDILNEAADEVQRNFIPYLNKRVSDIMKIITRGRYNDLRTDQSLSIRAIAPETGGIVPQGLLSAGTVDQLHLALRIAAAELIEGSEKIPFIMDEVFAQYDESRIKDTIQVLGELAKDRQILFFTCRKREVALAKEVLGNSLNVINL